MKLCYVIAVLALIAATLGQAPATPCPADRPVDEIIAEIHKQQSKKANRNKNPMPTTGCIFGWCRETARTPPIIPGTATNPEPSRPVDAPTASGETSSKTEADRCREALDGALQAAHDVEVGDQQMDEKHYPAALSRYAGAAEEKPNDAAIEVRLGRVLEKLNDPPKALEHYEAAAKLGTPEKWAKEALAAVERLKGKEKQ